MMTCDSALPCFNGTAGAVLAFVFDFEAVAIAAGAGGVGDEVWAVAAGWFSAGAAVDFCGVFGRNACEISSTTIISANAKRMRFSVPGSCWGLLKSLMPAAAS